MDDAPELILVCDACKESIAPGRGRLWIDYADINQRADAMEAWEAAHPKPEKGLRLHSFGAIMDIPGRVRWHAHHAACDPEPDAGAYTIDSERLTSWADLAHWTAHLMGHQWFDGTDWARLLDGVANDTGPRLRPARPSPLHA
jgi:hypothetical protein